MFIEKIDFAVFLASGYIVKVYCKFKRRNLIPMTSDPHLQHFLSKINRKIMTSHIVAGS
jgi:hypothetical protein